MYPNIALIGHPNGGKTSLFNALTQGNQKTGNYPGVTVERKAGLFTTAQGEECTLIDLPGLYSLLAKSPDEMIARDVILGKHAKEAPLDLLVYVADATQLNFHLRFLLELKATGIPMLLALNMMDLAQKRDAMIKIEQLAHDLDMPVIPVVAIHDQGIDALKEAISQRYHAIPKPAQLSWKTPDAADIRARYQQAKIIADNAQEQTIQPARWTKWLDKFILHPIAGPLILLALLLLIFQAIFSWSALPQEWIENGFIALQQWVINTLPDGPFTQLLANGIIAGVGGVLVFLPQIVMLFFFILLLEDSGYMARAAFLMDRLMGLVGLNGRAFIPLLSSFACAIPGIMATRTIENPRDRLITILIAPLMTCSARLPVYTLLIGAFIPAHTVWGVFNQQGLTLFALYLFGVFGSFIIALVLKHTLVKGKAYPLLLELPSYKLPTVRNLWRGLRERSFVFIRRAGTIILALTILLWFLSSYPGAPVGATEPAITYSFAGILGGYLEPVLRPIGFNLAIAIALIPGFAAREVAVAGLATVYAIEATEQGLETTLSLSLSHSWELATALAFLAWYIFAPQCISTLAVTRRETNSWRWPVIMFSYMLALAYGAAFITYRVTQYLVG